MEQINSYDVLCKRVTQLKFKDRTYKMSSSLRKLACSLVDLKTCLLTFLLKGLHKSFLQLVRYLRIESVPSILFLEGGETTVPGDK